MSMRRRWRDARGLCKPRRRHTANRCGEIAARHVRGGRHKAPQRRWWAQIHRANVVDAKTRRDQPHHSRPTGATMRWPWYPAGQVNGYQIVPLDSTEELWKEGQAMHHCAGSYDYRIAAGKCYMYSVRQGNNRLATVELVKKHGNVKPRQFEHPVTPSRPRT